jgi:hypothetical protein
LSREIGEKWSVIKLERFVKLKFQPDVGLGDPRF